MAGSRESWRERFARRITATHGRRIVTCTVMVLLSVGVTVWLVADPNEVLSRHRGWGAVLAPIGVLLFGRSLFLEFRTGDVRSWEPLGRFGIRRKQKR
jgi:hypothetical protein